MNCHRLKSLIPMGIQEPASRVAALYAWLRSAFSQKAVRPKNTKESRNTHMRNQPNREQSNRNDIERRENLEPEPRMRRPQQGLHRGFGSVPVLYKSAHLTSFRWLPLDVPSVRPDYARRAQASTVNKCACDFVLPSGCRGEGFKSFQPFVKLPVDHFSYPFQFHTSPSKLRCMPRALPQATLGSRGAAILSSSFSRRLSY
jgi:hypothetical protein